jgi:hypothetical protein
MIILRKFFDVFFCSLFTFYLTFFRRRHMKRIFYPLQRIFFYMILIIKVSVNENENQSTFIWDLWDLFTHLIDTAHCTTLESNLTHNQHLDIFIICIDLLNVFIPSELKCKAYRNKTQTSIIICDVNETIKVMRSVFNISHMI